MVFMAVKSLELLEKNVSASFGYVKKDLLMLNDAISDLNDKIQHLSLNHAALLEKLDRLVERPAPKKQVKTAVKKSTKRELEFYDLRAKKKFKTSKYAFRSKSGRRFAVATAPSGVASWRVIGSDPKSAPKNKVVKKKTSSSKPKKVVKETIVY